MKPDDLVARLQARQPALSPEAVRDFVRRMDADYFEAFTDREIARHLSAAATLDPDNPVQIDIQDATGEAVRIVVIAYDYLSEFAVIAGVLSSFGLDIRQATIYTSADVPAPATRRPAAPPGRPRRPVTSSRQTIVDVFHVAPTPGVRFGATERQALILELEGAIRLLDARRLADARRLVNRRLVERLGKTFGQPSGTGGLLRPIAIRFDNHTSRADTIMDIRSPDTPGFLYAFANALAMRGVSVRKADIRSVGEEVHDRFFVRDRVGRKIEDPEAQQDLRLAATLIKQFTHFLPGAPDPGKAIESFDRFLDLVMAGGRGALATLKEQKQLTLLARVLGSSEFLWEEFVRRQHANLLPVLDTYRRGPLHRSRRTLQQTLRRALTRARGMEARRQALNRFKDKELFRIDMKHVLDPSTALTDFSAALTELAEVVIEETVGACAQRLSRVHGVPRLEDGTRCPFAVLGMGKFGGKELGYASDIEVLFVYGGTGRTDGRVPLDNSEYVERLAHDILRWIEAKQEGIFHVDVRLRPHGSKGPLATSLDEVRRYYSPGGLAAPFERQALIKLRPVAGDPTAGEAVAAHRDAYVYSGQPWDLAQALALRRQQIRELVAPETLNIKYSAGGLVDAEYAVQYLQLLHGARHRRVQTPNTLAAIDALKAAGALAPKEAAALHDAYLFFRRLIDALRIVRGHAKDLELPGADSDAAVFLARRMGYVTETWADGARKLYGDIARHMTWTKKFFASRFGPVE